MDAAYAKSPEAQPLFAAARAALERTIGWLEATETAGQSHSEVERRLHRDGLEVLRLLFEAPLVLRAQAEATSGAVGAQGAERSHVRSGTRRQLETVFGTVTAQRSAFGGRGLSSLFPTDAALNL